MIPSKGKWLVIEMLLHLKTVRMQENFETIAKRDASILEIKHFMHYFVVAL